MRRRLAIALSVSIVLLALAPGAGLARGPQKNDSVSGHGLVVFDPTTTYEFRVSAHTISDTTTVATGNMFLRLTLQDPTLGTVVIDIWADVFCTSVLANTGEVRGHIYRTEPDLGLHDTTDLIFNVTDLNRVSDAPDLFTPGTEETAISTCIEPPAPGLTEVDKGNITVNDE
jgi:hypothetical protein